jgi:dihydroflavonol-4-reductase
MATLVTGATGFLGSHLVRALVDRGEEVRVLVRPRTDPRELLNLPVEIARGDLGSPETLTAAMRGIDRVYHAAAKVDVAASSDLGMSQINSDGTRHVLESAWRAGVERVVYTSSVGAIGACEIHEQLNEDDCYRGRGTNLPYPRSKVLADRVAMEFVKRGLPIVPVYPTLFFGPGDRYLRTSKTILAYLDRRTPAYIAGGFGCSDVRDVAAGHVQAMDRGQPGRRYILGGWNVTLREFYGLLARITQIAAPTLRVPAVLGYALAIITKWVEPIRGKPPVVTWGDVDNARLYWFYDYTRGQEELGLRCRPLIETLRDTVAWLRDHIHDRARTSKIPPPHVFEPSPARQYTRSQMDGSNGRG